MKYLVTRAIYEKMLEFDKEFTEASCEPIAPLKVFSEEEIKTFIGHGVMHMPDERMVKNNIFIKERMKKKGRK